MTVALRPVSAEDLWLYDRYAADPEAAGHFNWSGYKNSTKIRRAYAEGTLITPDEGRLIVTASDAVAGDVTWHKATYGIPAWWCWNIGIALLPEHRHRGIGPRAQHLLTAYLFDTTPVQRIEAHTDVANLPEQRALEKIGFTREGRIRAAQFRAATWQDLYLYSLLRPVIHSPT